VGTLWDVGTFWPRAFHPLAPPSYAERAVPDLARRIERLTKDRDGQQGRVLLMAHSQGAVLAAAALLQVDPDAMRRVGLVTYGAPLTRLYRRAFPAYFGGRMLTRLHRALSEQAAGTTVRWTNFHRETDLIGGPVFVGPEEVVGGDRRLRDPSTKYYVFREPLPPVRGHSGYMKDPVMRTHVDELAEQLLQEVQQPHADPPRAGPPPRPEPQRVG
jgi:pimeloyl-ACP methyl ester carboxylesterase